MDRPEARHEPTNVVRLRTTGPPGPELSELLEQAVRVAVGAAALAVGAAVNAVARTLGQTPVIDEEALDEEPQPVRGVPLLIGAALGLAWETGRWSVRAASTAGRSIAPLASFAVSPAFVRRRLDAVEGRLAGLDERWRGERPRNEDAAEAILHLVVPEIVNAALDQIDLTELVVDRVDIGRVIDRVDFEAVIARVPVEEIVARLDLNEIVARIDLDAIVGRIDLDAAVQRIDLQRIVERVDLDTIIERVDLDTIIERIDLDTIIERIDVDTIVGRIDLNEIVGRIDLDTIVERLDLAGIATRVIEEIDLPQIIRASSGTMTAEAAEGIRVQSMEADSLVAGVVDRILRRRGRDTDVDQGTGEATTSREEGSN